MAPAEPKKLFDPKLNKNKSEFDQSIFIRKSGLIGQRSKCETESKGKT